MSPELDLTRTSTRKALLRVVPLLTVGGFMAYIDRTNLGIAALDLTGDFGMDPKTYGLVAGIFFIGYMLFEVPSNVIMHKVGARPWLARIMLSWGILTILSAFTQDTLQFTIVRFFLGIAEAGYYPGVYVVLAMWFPRATLGRAMAIFLGASPVALAFGAPIGALLLRLGGTLGWSGWRWLFLIEGIPALFVGVLIYLLLPSRPADAKWLSTDERTALENALVTSPVDSQAEELHGLRLALRDRRVLLLGTAYLGVNFGFYGLAFWLPQIIKNELHIASSLTVGFLVAAIFLPAWVASLVVARHSDRASERVKHLIWPMGIGGAVLMITPFFGIPWASYVAIGIAAMAIISAYPVFWSIPSSFLVGVAAAGGIALINTIANAAGFIGPYFIGWMTQLFGDSRWGVFGIAVLMLVCAALIRYVSPSLPASVRGGDKAKSPSVGTSKV